MKSIHLPVYSSGLRVKKWWLTRIWGAYRKSQDYALFYSAMQLCSSYSGTYCQGLAYEKRTGRVSFLLSFLPGTGWGKQRQENCLLLYIHWRILFSNIRWHDLRSTFCTLLLKNDFNPKAVSRLMGRWAMQKRLLRLMCMEIIADCVDEIQPFIDEVLPNENLDLELQTENMDVVISADDYLI